MQGSDSVTDSGASALRRTRMADGRTLAWCEWGDADGWPVMFFHGGADSRLQGRVLHDDALDAGVRVIAPDRPGYGASDPQADRRFTDWPHDVHALADHLSLERFSVMGHSGGGPHALAVAADARGRIEVTVVVAGAAPRQASTRGLGIPFRINRRLTISIPSLQRRLMASHRDDVYGEPEPFLSRWGRVSEPEARLFDERPDVGWQIVEDMREGFAQGIDAAAHESRLYFTDWGIDLEGIESAVHLVYGGEDRQAPPSWGEHLRAKLPGATLEVIEGQAHMSVLVNEAPHILGLARPRGSNLAEQ